MNRTITVVVTILVAAGLSTMIYTVPKQRAIAEGGFGGFGGCGLDFSGCNGGFFGDPFGFSIHKHIIQTITQINTCPGNGDNQKTSSNDDQDQNQKDKHTVCLNTAVNTDGRNSVTLGAGSFNPIESTDGGHKQPSKEIAIKPADDHKQPSKKVVIGGNGGSGGAGGAGGEGGQGGANIDDSTNKSNSSVNQTANGGDANGGHGGNTNGGDAKTLIFTLH